MTRPTSSVLTATRRVACVSEQQDGDAPFFPPHVAGEVHEKCLFTRATALADFSVSLGSSPALRCASVAGGGDLGRVRAHAGPGAEPRRWLRAVRGPLAPVVRASMCCGRACRNVSVCCCAAIGERSGRI